MPMRLEMARAQIKQFKEDRTFNRVVSPKELEAMGKLSRILALLREVQADFVEVDLGKSTSTPER